MDIYKYKALSPEGTQVKGVVEAYDEFEAAAQIKQTCPIVLQLELVPGKKERIDLNEPLWVSEKVLAMVCSQFSILLKAGLPIVRTVELIADQTSDRLMKKILRQVAGDVSSGYSLAASFTLRGKKIPVAFLESVRAGEEAGTLEAAFERLVTYFNKSYTMKRKVRSAMMYPAFLCVLAVIVVSIIMIVTMPVLVGIFDGFGGELPLPTRILIGISDGLTAFWPFILVGIAALFFLFKLYGRTAAGRLKLSQLALRLPVLGKMNLLKGAAQFANTLSTLLSSGLPLPRALHATSRVLDSYAMGQAVGQAILGVEEGRALGAVLNEDPYLPPLLKEMAAVGEEAGTLEDTLATIGAYYDSETETATGKALAMLEPAITIVMGVVIGFIVIALYIPMFTMYSGMGG
ncbi:MAG: type II secretion system F family protein [Oscillospiraceae bacterium]